MQGLKNHQKKKPLIAEPNNLFGEDELKFIKDEGLIEPNELLKLEKGKLIFLENNVKARRNALSSEIGAFKRKKDPKKSDFMENQSNLEVRDILNRYLQTIEKVSDVPCTQKRDQESESINNQKETHIRFLIHPFGNLSVDVPKLKNEMKLNVFRGGKSFITLMRINHSSICLPKDSIREAAIR